MQGEGGKQFLEPGVPSGCSFFLFFFVRMIYSFGKTAAVCLLSPAGRRSQKPCEVKVASAAPGLSQRWFAVGEHLQLL